MRRTHFTQVIKKVTGMTDAQINVRLQNVMRFGPFFDASEYDAEEAIRALLAVVAFGMAKDCQEASRATYEATDADGTRLGDVLAAEIEARAGFTAKRDPSEAVTGLELCHGGGTVTYGDDRRVTFGLAGEDLYFFPCQRIPTSLFNLLAALHAEADEHTQSAIESRRSAALACVKTISS